MASEDKADYTKGNLGAGGTPKRTVLSQGFMGAASIRGLNTHNKQLGRTAVCLRI